MQVSDLAFPIIVDDDSWPENSAMKKWSSLILEAASKFGRFADSAKSYKAQMIDVGFQELVEIQFKWPLNRWPKEKKLKEWGKWLMCPTHDVSLAPSPLKASGSGNQQSNNIIGM